MPTRWRQRIASTRAFPNFRQGVVERISSYTYAIMFAGAAKFHLPTTYGGYAVVTRWLRGGYVWFHTDMLSGHRLFPYMGQQDWLQTRAGSRAVKMSEIRPLDHSIVHRNR